MNFDLGLAKRDVKKVKTFCAKNGFATALPKIGSGGYATVHGFGAAAARVTDVKPNEYYDKHIAFGETAIERDINIAPMLAHTTTLVSGRKLGVELYPRLDGITLQQFWKTAAPEDYLTFPPDAYQKFLENFIDIKSIGYIHETQARNIMVTGDETKEFNFIDLEPHRPRTIDKSERENLLYWATVGIFPWHLSRQEKARRTVLGNVESALLKTPDSTLALDRIRQELAY